jgi:ATP-dependent RNA helicase DDX3X
MAQVARPTFNPFTGNGFNNNQQFYGQRPNNGFQNNGFNNGFQNNGFNNGFQNNGFQNGYQRPNNGFQNNGFQQQGNQGNNSSPQLFTRRFHLNNGYLYGRPTLYYDPKSNKVQPWVRKNLR